MKQWFCGLIALGLFVGMAGPAKSQPTYCFTTLDVPGSAFSSTEGHGINDSGQIVGDYYGDTAQHGFLLDNGSYTTLDVPGATYTYANGINASGQIVGGYYDGKTHGFLLDQGSYTTLDRPGSTSTFARGINGSSQIVGDYGDAGGRHAFLATPLP